jgi:putative metalloprotease
MMTQPEKMMKKPFPLAVLSTIAATLIAGCAGSNINGLTDAGGALFKAASLSDADVKSMADQACAQSDQQNRFAATNSTYSKRLTRIVEGLNGTGVPVQARVYMAQDVNAWAMANGCVRVYSGLMDMMTDDEVRGVLGHEIGHVALGHTKKKMQVAYTALAARGALGASGNGAVSALSQSQLGDLAQSLINAQFSQTEESAADDYSFDLLTRNRGNRQALVSAFQKLAKLDGGHSSIFSSHPGSADRAKHIQDRIATGH